MEKIGIFGGTFNPVHAEHVEVAIAAINELNLDKLIIMPTFSSPHKTLIPASAEDRINMLSIAFSGIDKAVISDYEIKKQGTSFTYLTVEHYKELYPNAKLFFIVGGDMLTDFKTWKFPERILAAATLAVFERENFKTDFAAEKKYFKQTFDKDFIKLSYIGKNFSSTKIRVYSMLNLDLEGICIPAVSGLFSRRLLQSKAAVYLQSRLAETKKQNGRFVLTVFGPDGFFALSCDRILDTRTKALPQTVQRQYAFCAMLAGKSGEFTAPPKTLGPLRVLHGRFSDEYLLRLPLEKPLPLPLAAEQLTTHWAQHQSLAPGLKIAAFATRLEERLLAPYCREENGTALVPSAGYENLLTAATEGFLWNFAH